MTLRISKTLHVALAALPFLLATGCGLTASDSKDGDSQPTQVSDTSHEDDDHAHDDHADDDHADDDHADGENAGHTHGEWWCAEHGIPEEQCGMCDAKVAAQCREKGDWCEEHNRPDSQCFVCHPENAEKYTALYEAKYGKKPPQATE